MYRCLSVGLCLLPQGGRATLLLFGAGGETEPVIIPSVPAPTSLLSLHIPHTADRLVDFRMHLGSYGHAYLLEPIEGGASDKSE